MHVLSLQTLAYRVNEHHLCSPGEVGLVPVNRTNAVTNVCFFPARVLHDGANGSPIMSPGEVGLVPVNRTNAVTNICFFPARVLHDGANGSPIMLPGEVWPGPL